MGMVRGDIMGRCSARGWRQRVGLRGEELVSHAMPWRNATCWPHGGCWGRLEGVNAAQRDGNRVEIRAQR